MVWVWVEVWEEEWVVVEVDSEEEWVDLEVVQTVQTEVAHQDIAQLTIHMLLIDIYILYSQ
jgi:hypothetical protein